MYSKTILIGNLGRDPEYRVTAGNRSVVNLRIATNEKWTDDAGEKKESTEWHNVAIWGRSAEAARDLLKKGSLIMVEGQIKTHKWQNDKGQDILTTEIECRSFKLLRDAPGSVRTSQPSSGYDGSNDQLPSFGNDEDPL